MNREETKLSIGCNTLLELSWLAAIILAPLFFNVHSERVFEPDKITLIRSLAVFMTAVWLVKFVDQRGWQQLDWLRPRHEQSIWRVPLVLPTAAVVLIYILSSLFSVTPSASWFGSYQRLQGTYTTLSYIVIFAIMAATIRSQEQVRRVVTLVIITSIPVALYGIFQRFGLDTLPWGGDTQSRIAGHMGNAIFVAAYLIMATPLTLARIISSFTSILGDEELNLADIIRSSIYIFAFAIQLIAIYWSGSRGPLLGLLLGVFALISVLLVALRNNVMDDQGYRGQDILAACFGLVAGLGGLILAVILRPSVGDGWSLVIFLGVIGLATFAVFVLIALRRGWKWLWLSWLLLAGFAGLWLTLFNLSGNWAADYGDVPVLGETIQTLDAWRQLPSVGRYGRLLESESSTGKVRVLIWEGVIDLLTPHAPIAYPDGQQDNFNFLRPLIGYGPESMYVAYNGFYPAELATVEARNASPDRAHNETWDALVITGLLGFLAWQWLYLSVFYYSFRWLGVVRTARDRTILIALWIGVGLLTAFLFVQWQGVEFMGVALPFGSIIGLVLYLIYYALSVRPDPETAAIDPFDPSRLMMIALLGAIIAHFVEIHFGIAIVSTRTHFFVYMGLLLLMGHLLPHRVAEAEPVRRVRGATKRALKRAAFPSWVSPVLMWGLLLALLVAVLGYNFTIFTPRPDVVISSRADLPTFTDIFYQSFFVNPARDFADAPFLFLLLIMSWLLGLLVAVSEMIKSGTLVISTTIVKPLKNSRTAGYLFVGLVVLCLGLFVTGWLGGDTATWSMSQRIGRLTLAPLGAILAVQAALPLLRQRPHASLTAGAIVLVGLALALPIMIAGGWGYGLLIMALSVVLLYLLWSDELTSLVWPTLTLIIISLGLGLSFCLLHAQRIHLNLITPPGVTEQTAETMRRVAEAQQFASILSLFYIFLFFTLLTLGILAALPRMAQRPSWGSSTNGWIALVILLPLSFIVIRNSNLQVIQADMIYKRGQPWDAQAPAAARQSPSEGLSLWDNAIAIYQEALDLAPQEDFYYLWLGRAYLEKSSLLEEEPRDIILQTAEESLYQAQALNPLNTDHTANLARLNTRWASVLHNDVSERDYRVTEADRHYQGAIALSPQNAVIRNEYARMVYTFSQSCAEGEARYEESLEADPFYYRTRFEIAEISLLCARNADAETQASYYETALTQLREGTRLAVEKPGRERTQARNQISRSWLQAAQFFQEQEAWSEALVAYEALRDWPSDLVAGWRVDFSMATAYAQLGQLEAARTAAERALQTAPVEVTPSIEQFIIDELADS